MTGQNLLTRPGPPLRRIVAGALALLAAVVLGLAGCSSAPVSGPPLASPGNVAGPPVEGPPLVGVAPMGKAPPDRVQIPAIGVDSALMGLGLRPDGSMQVPPGAFPAGWYTGAPTPGELGPAVLAGHIDWAGRTGVFFRLRELKPADEVTVTRQDGTAAVFRVTQVAQYPKTSFPTAAVYGNINHPGLRLITCGGALDRRAHSYNDNVVVYADLVAARPA